MSRGTINAARAIIEHPLATHSLRAERGFAVSELAPVAFSARVVQIEIAVSLLFQFFFANRRSIFCFGVVRCFGCIASLRHFLICIKNKLICIYLLKMIRQ
jgi:hypothetical protein